jgi:hypothetical protein
MLLKGRDDAPTIPGEHMILPCHRVFPIVDIGQAIATNAENDKPAAKTDCGALFHKEIVDQPCLPNVGGDRHQ